jgi:3-methyladenine DNA glycosylase/8-oxoguanine DNA glycosylase
MKIEFNSYSEKMLFERVVEMVVSRVMSSVGIDKIKKEIVNKIKTEAVEIVAEKILEEIDYNEIEKKALNLAMGRLRSNENTRSD